MSEHRNFFKIKDNFAVTEHIASTPIFENRLAECPKYTIGICTYKRTNLLVEAIESALSQDTDIPYEIIVCDNAPERGDDVEKLMQRYKDVKNLSYYKNEENIGGASNWNRLVTLSRSEYFIMLHDDDCLAPFYIRLVDELWSRLPADVGLLQTSKTSRNSFTESENKKTVRRIWFSDCLHLYAVTCPSGACYRREVLLKLGGWNKDYSPNLDYCFDMLLALHYKIYVTPKQATFYRWEDNDSMRYATRVGLVKNDFQLHEAMLRKLHIPGWFRRRWLEEMLPQQLTQYDLKIADVAPLRMDKYNPKVRHIAFVLVNRYVGWLRKLNLCR